MNKLLIVIAVLSLSACKTISNKPVTQADYDRYFDNQIIQKNLILRLMSMFTQ